MQVSETHLARRLMDWSDRGFPELGDSSGQGLDAYTKGVISHPQFSEAPKNVSIVSLRVFFMCIVYEIKTNLIME